MTFLKVNHLLIQLQMLNNFERALQAKILILFLDVKFWMDAWLFSGNTLAKIAWEKAGIFKVLLCFSWSVSLLLLWKLCMAYLVGICSGPFVNCKCYHLGEIIKPLMLYVLGLWSMGNQLSLFLNPSLIFKLIAWRRVFQHSLLRKKKKLWVPFKRGLES